MKIGDYVSIKIEHGIQDTGLIVNSYVHEEDAMGILYEVLCINSNKIAIADSSMLEVISNG